MATFIISAFGKRALRRDIWKLGIGAVVYGLLIASCGYSLQIAPTTVEKQWPIRPAGMSPQIGVLKRRIASGDTGALKEFWLDAARKGTPLIEAASGSPHDVLVTFVWRGDDKTESVGVLAPLEQSPGVPNLPLQRLLDTDLWYGTWQMRDNLRFTYRFAQNLKSGDNAQRSATTDPLNPEKMEIAFEGSGAPATEFSIASMPSAPAERWITKQKYAPEGKLELQSLKSGILGGDRKVWIYTPPGYSEKTIGGYRLLVLFDGFTYLNWVPTPTVLDNLIHAGEIPPTVAVLIDNPPNTRNSELGPHPAIGEFVAKELMPWIRDRWNVTRDPRMTILGGYSYGGAAAAAIALRRPELFGNVLSQSGAFWAGNKDVHWEWVNAQYEASPKQKLRFFLEAGSLEDVSKDGPTLLTANRHMVNILKHKGYPVTYEEVGGTHEPVHWRDTLAPGLISLAR
jgi:enterochelin esterase family protein